MHSAYQHRLGYVGNPMAMWRLRKMHRALGKALLLFSFAQIVLGIDTYSGMKMLDTDVGIAFVSYATITWAAIFFLEYQRYIHGELKKEKSHGKHGYVSHLRYMGREDLKRDNHVYIQLVKVCDEIFRRLPVEPRKAMFMYFKQTGESLNAMYIRFVPCKYIRNYRSLRSEVLIEFIEFVKNNLLETNHDSYREMKEFISDKVKSIRMAGKGSKSLERIFSSDYCPVGVFLPHSSYEKWSNKYPSIFYRTTVMQSQDDKQNDFELGKPKGSSSKTIESDSVNVVLDNTSDTQE